MVDINNVRSTVLTILQKENRGWIPAGEFNDLARQAQLEIFEAYFTDLAHYSLNPKGRVMEAGYANIIKNLEEKIDIFSKRAALPSTNYDSTNNQWSLPTDSYRLDTVIYNPTTGSNVIVNKMDKDMQPYVSRSPRLTPDLTFPKYVRLENNLRIYPDSIDSGIEIYYIKQPSEPVWNSISFGASQPVYDADTSTDFELHKAEEYMLVEKILLYAGVLLREPGVTQFAAQDLIADEQRKKS